MENYTEHLEWLERMNPSERRVNLVQHYTEDGDRTEIFGNVEFEMNASANEVNVLESDKALTEDDIRLHFENFKVTFA